MYRDLIVSDDTCEPELMNISAGIDNKDWSILSTIPSYTQPSLSQCTPEHVKVRAPENQYKSKAYHRLKHSKNPNILNTPLPPKLNDIFPDVSATVTPTLHFDENVDISTTYLG